MITIYKFDTMVSGDVATAEMEAEEVATPVVEVKRLAVEETATPGATLATPGPTVATPGATVATPVVEFKRLAVEEGDMSQSYHEIFDTQVAWLDVGLEDGMQNMLKPTSIFLLLLIRNCKNYIKQSMPRSWWTLSFC